MKIVFFGAGNMAMAIISHLKNYSIELIQHNTDKITQLQALGYVCFNKLDAELAEDDILVLAIKPQQAKSACLSIQQYATKCTVVSVMTSISINSLERWLCNSKVVRTMPNTPASIGKGITAIYFNKFITATAVKSVESIFTPLGTIYYAKNEIEIDKIIPVSSSNIAFIYNIIDIMINHSIKLGFEAKDAKQIILEAFKGSVAMIEANDKIPIQDLQSNVTSKGGTTERGIKVFEEQHLNKTIETAMDKCLERAFAISLELNTI